MKIWEEGGTRFHINEPQASIGPGKRSGPGFFNPAMAPAREMMMAALRVEQPGSLLDAMCATGTKAFRAHHEAVPEARLVAMDLSRAALDFAAATVRDGARVDLVRGDLLEPPFPPGGFNWVDVDPFGTPAPFLVPALAMVVDGGVLSLTATDTQVLNGGHRASEGRYGARSHGGRYGQEVGLRILAGWVLRVAHGQGRSGKLLMAYSAGHYLRVYLRVGTGGDPSEHLGMVHVGIGLERDASGREGPLWLGPPGDEDWIAKVRGELRDPGQHRLLDLLGAEPALTGFYHSDEVARASGGSSLSRRAIEEQIGAVGGTVAWSHHDPKCFHTDLRDPIRVLRG